MTMVLNANQQIAVDKSADIAFSLITGGAGTGKTTIIKSIAKKLGNVTLCAPTGKAAARLRESTGMPASTLHSFLKFNGSKFMAGSLVGDNLVIDEASMLDASLLSAVVTRRPDRLVLVGDSAQLPPVGRAQPFHDIINLRPDIVTQLDICYRNTEAVFKAATSIRNGDMPNDKDHSENEKWEIRPTGDPVRTQVQLTKMVKDGVFDFEQDIILCARNGEKKNPPPGTVHGLNKAIVDIVNPRKYGERWKVGDRIICLKNYPDKDVWNGTTGTIHAIDSEKSIWVRTDIQVMDDCGQPTDRVKFNGEMISNMQLAYALTVHKSQGSQYRKVVFCCFQRDSFMMLSRPLIYTGVTRAQQECIVMGNKQAFRNGINVLCSKRTVLQELAKIHN